MNKDKDNDVDADERIQRRAGSVEEGHWVPGDPAAGPSTANSPQCKSFPEFAAQLVSTSTKITSIWLLAPLSGALGVGGVSDICT